MLERLTAQYSIIFENLTLLIFHHRSRKGTCDCIQILKNVENYVFDAQDPQQNMRPLSVESETYAHLHTHRHAQIFMHRSYLFLSTTTVII